MVSEACQINDLDHPRTPRRRGKPVSEACQINDLDHGDPVELSRGVVSEACQINDLDHVALALIKLKDCFRSLSDQ